MSAALRRENSKRDSDELWVCAKGKKKLLWYLSMAVLFPVFFSFVVVVVIWN